MVKNTLVKIDSVDVTSYLIADEIEETYSDNTDMIKIRLSPKITDVLTPSKFQTIEVWENYSGTLEVDANKEFRGQINKIEREVTGIVITCYCEMWKAIQTLVNKTYDKNIDASAGEGSEIFKDLSDLSGLSYDSSSIVATGTSAGSIILEKFVCDNTDAMERMQVLAEIYGYQFYYRADTDKVYFEPRGQATNTNTIYIGGVSNNVQGVIKWKFDSREYCNVAEVKGAYQEVQNTRTFSGNASDTEFALVFEPEIVKVIVDSVEQVGGVLGSTETFDYYVDKSNKKIIFLATSIPGSGTDNIEVLYSYRAPIPCLYKNQSAIAEIGREVKRIFTFNDIQSVDDAEQRAKALAEIFSEEFRSTKTKLKQSVAETINPQAGEIIPVSDTFQNISGDFLIKKVRKKWPTGDVEIEVGDRESRVMGFECDTSLRIKRLEEEMSKASTFIVQRMDFFHTLGITRRYLKLEKRDLQGGFVLGHPDYGVLGTNELGEDFSAYTQEFVQQSDNIYQEDFIDSDFESSSTTATWGGGDLDFTSGQIAESESIDYDNGTIPKAKFEISISSGTLKLEATADGTNWETVVASFTANQNITHYFSNTGSDLAWRLTEIGASTSKVIRVKVSNYH